MNILDIKKDIRESLILRRLFQGHTTKAKKIWGARVFLGNLIKSNCYDKKERKLIVSSDFEENFSIEFILLLSCGKGIMMRSTEGFEPISNSEEHKEEIERVDESWKKSFAEAIEKQNKLLIDLRKKIENEIDEEIRQKENGGLDSGKRR